MIWRLVFWLGAALVLLIGVALSVPNSPFYLPKLHTSGGYYNGHSTSYWVKELDNSDPKARRQAIFALGAIGPEAEQGVPALARILAEDDEPETRNAAALALTKMVPASRSAVPELAQALSDNTPLVRMNAAMALSRLKEEARPAVPALLQALADDANQTNANAFSFTIQEQVVLALGRATAGTADAVATLIEVLDRAETDSLRAAAVRALGMVGPEARPAVPQLQKALKARDTNLREAAAEALQEIQGKKPGA